MSSYILTGEGVMYVWQRGLFNFERSPFFEVEFHVPEKCNEISAETAKAGDRYYKVVSEWIRGRMSSSILRQKARRLADVYRRSLELAIACYSRVRGSVTAKKEINYARELQTLLDKDMEILGRTTGELKPPAAPARTMNAAEFRTS